MYKQSRILCLSGTIAVMLCGSDRASADAAEFVLLGCLAEQSFGCGSFAAGVSADGHVVVGRTHVEIEPGVIEFQAFRWAAETGMVALGSLPGGIARSTANDISGDGSTIVGSAPSVTFSLEAYLWQTHDDGMIGLGGFALPSADMGHSNYSVAQATSYNGSVIVGHARSLTFTNPIGQANPEAFATIDGKLIPLGKLPGGVEHSYAFGVSADGTVVVGASGSTDGTQAYRWTLSEGMLPLGPAGTMTGSIAVAASADGSTIVGRGGKLSPDDYEAFRWSKSEGVINLGVLPGGLWHESTAYAVSADGSVVVGTSTSHIAPYGGDGFIWTEATGMRSLRQVLELQGATDLDGWILRARAISADGLTIVGAGEHPEHGEEPWIARLTHLPVFADMNGDGTVNTADLLILLGAWGSCINEFDCPADLNGDSVVDVTDLLELLAAWG